MNQMADISGVVVVVGARNSNLPSKELSKKAWFGIFVLVSGHFFFVTTLVSKPQLDQPSLMELIFKQGKLYFSHGFKRHQSYSKLD